MKSKKSLLLIAFSLIFALCVSIFNNNSFEAKADTLSNVDCVFGASYTTEYLLEKAGCAKLEGQTTFAGGRSVKYKADAETETVVAGTDVKFLTKGAYTFTTFVNDAEEHIFTVNVVDKSVVKADSMKYSTDSALIEEYKAEIAKTVAPGEGEALDTNDSFTVPSLEKLLSSKYFKYSDLTKSIYYAGPQDTSYASTSSSKFKLSGAGYYSYYVLATDPVNNKMSTEDLTEKNDGWYNEANELVIPIFSFEIKNIAAPEISVLTSEKGYIGLDYTIECFTINASNYTSKYTLYYSEEYFDKDDESYATDADYIKAVTEAEGTSDITEEYLDVDALKFSPDKKGYYYVLLNVGDDNGLSDAAMSRAISVQSTYTKYSVESEWLKYNKTSVIFLSISVVCFIAIIVILFIKPKDYNVEIDMNE
ncbi:MAG: hypothetical protein ACI4M6_04890 [Christensenellaceae bacterium]